jgi:hypothetical protein
MKTRLFLALAGFAAVSQSPAAVGYFGNFYIVTSTNGGANAFNQVTSPANNLSNAGGGFNLVSDGFNPSLGSFGTIDVGTGGSLVLNGFEMLTFHDGDDSVNTAIVFYRVTKDGDVPGSFSSTSMNSPTSSNPNGFGGIDRFWQKTDAGVNLTTGLSNGNYTINFYVQNDASFTGGGGGTFIMNNWNSSSGPSATFSVIPEPASALLGLAGTAFLLRRRRE